MIVNKQLIISNKLLSSVGVLFTGACLLTDGSGGRV